MNTCLFSGNLTRDCETRFTQGGTPVVSFGLAVRERYKGSDGEWKEDTAFVDCTIFGKTGEWFARDHKKGSYATVQCRLKQERWQDKETGANRSKLAFVVLDFHRTPRRDQESSEHAPAGDENTPF